MDGVTGRLSGGGGPSLSRRAVRRFGPPVNVGSRLPALEPALVDRANFITIENGHTQAQLQVPKTCLEARTGFEPVNKGFADLCLTGSSVIPFSGNSPLQSTNLRVFFSRFELI